MQIRENPQFSLDYLDPKKRSIANSLRLIFKDGSQIELIICEYPIGHKRRREEGLPILLNKFASHLKTRLKEDQVKKMIKIMNNLNCLSSIPVVDFMGLWQITK